MGIGAPDAEGAHPGAQHAVPLPRAVLAADHERPAVDVQFGVGTAEVQRGRNRPVLEAQDRLDQPGHPGRGLEVADVGFDRSEVARPWPVLVGDRESLPQPFDLDGVAQWRSGSVRLDVAHRGGIDLGDGVRLGDHLSLACSVGRGVVHLRRAVVVQRRAPDDGMDPVTVVERILQPLEHDDTHAAAEYRSIRSDVEGTASAGGRHHRAGFVPVPDAVRYPDGGTACQRHLAFAVQDALAGEVDGDQ